MCSLGSSMAASSKRKLAQLSVDEFLTSTFDTDSNSSSDEEETAVTDVKKGGKREIQGGNKKEEPLLEVRGQKKVKQKSSIQEHKEQLSRLKEKDPEFFEFLEKNDQKLLNFEDTDSSEDDENELHTLPEKLELASDDEEDIKQPTKRTKAGDLIIVTTQMVENWKAAAEDKLTFKLFHDIVMAFKAAVSTTKGGDASGDPGKYKVEDSLVFNSLVSFCIRDLLLAVQKLLQLKPAGDQKKLLMPSSSPRWPKIRQDVCTYLTGLIQLLSSLTEATVVHAVLQHVLCLVSYYMCFPKQCRLLLKQTIKQWSTGEEIVRVLAFLILNKICRYKQDVYLDPVLKQMYVAYVKNCKFTSPNVLPLINFMQRTLTEMYALDTQVTYQHAFIYIRQLAIHLRNAMVMKKKETYQSVYNWQFVHCLYLWCRVLSTIYPSEVLEPLIYPLTQVTIGCIKLVPTARFFPLRLHCVRALTLLSDCTHTFIPVMPFILEVFQQVDFNKKPGRMSFRPINFTVILKLSSANLHEKAFRDGLIEQLYDLILEYYRTQAHTIGFPELVLPAVIQLKTFLKECKVANYCKQIKQLLEKLQENSSYISGRRQKAAFGVVDKEAVALWEKTLKAEGTPLHKYYNIWKKLREKEIIMEISGKERLEDLDFPEIKRRKLQERKEKDKTEFKDLFESDSDSDDESSVLKSKGVSKEGDEDFLEDLSDMSGEGDEDDDVLSSESELEDDSPQTSSKAPNKLSQADLKALTEGEEDIVEDLEFSDED
ncbi:nucleolar complex protein 2 homolog [Chiloscyllium plagiosum]|uniref:nucleolar complex protein 2 homolog n=1 Tax=Chiloscyllium plagiosum TaxID=36176 RepID=UPI001CB85D0E|nr:nucleolar complex protein 2 homolog [Chiloscyllium plagiosum]